MSSFLSSGIDFRTGGATLTHGDVAECHAVFRYPMVLRQTNGLTLDPKVTLQDPQMQKVHDKIQSDVAKNLRRNQYRLLPSQMILARTKAYKLKAADIISEVKKYKDELVKANVYSNIDINDLVDSKYDELYKALNKKLDLEFPCNDEAKK